jgi:hypothetical protein
MHESESGTKLPSADVRCYFRFWGKAENICSLLDPGCVKTLRSDVIRIV